MRRRRFLAVGLGVAGCLAGCGTEQHPPGRAGMRGPYSILPGGERWRQVTRAFSKAMHKVGVPVATRGPAVRITVTGLPALAAAELNNGHPLAETATPLARLAGEVEVVLVPGDSRFKTFEDFGAHLRAKPGETPLAGGPQGEPDHLLFGLIAKGVGADTRQVDYTGYPSSVEAGTALFGGRAAAAAGTLADWRAHIERGRVRVLAVSCAKRFPGVDAPSLLESGVRVDFANWCAAVGPAGMADDVRASAVRMCEEVTGSTAWQQACRAGGWAPIPLAGEQFEQWLASEVRRTQAVMRDLGLREAAGGTTCWGSCGHGH
ncbi:tripartite tricarboxylate transporter substrate-binding protein [Nonomuraea sp. LPB2021202275-12-8]|uniref:tripartite tricarboxylate transporter substrate-binding protein n=1 Tax=Nonomuraea sp. LPB2021202275-12-8 TaxID=3120159 RepID=UPI00300CB907